MTLDRMWQAVVDRDRRADGLFVYGVRSTKVYCRPSCGSRRPRRDRVEFFPAPAMAEASGFRACRRCRPGRPGEAASAGVHRACLAVARRPDARWTSAALARAAGTSVSRLQRGFRKALGLSPRDYVAACRRRCFLDTLRRGRTVTDAVYEAGYGSPSRVYAATARGLCFVAVGEQEAGLVAALRHEYPRADVAPRASARLIAWARAARAVADGGAWDPHLPVDIRGTAFQWRVWRALTKIPRGETRSYGDVARSIGRPTAARAVARACATNPLPLVVPCHRVVAQDGTTGGYRWGRARKTALLHREQRG
jgi:AraC family transcriptional regulator of adaptative response/methylated-DNA-[protein]-cysteine methyltransferase